VQPAFPHNRYAGHAFFQFSFAATWQ